MLEGLQNIYKIPELKKRIVFTMIMFAVFRMGTHIPVPGVNPSVIEQLFSQGNLFGLLDLFSGGALSKFSIFAMSITPYINASIIIQLLTVVFPTLEQWQKEGQDGHKKMQNLTRYFAVILAFLQAIGMGVALNSAIINPGVVSILIIAITLTAGTVFLMWIGDQITAYGVGNGTSLIIFAGIVAALPKHMMTIYRYTQAGTISYANAVFFMLIVIAMVVFVILINEGCRRIPISYTRRIVGGRFGGGRASHIPLKVNQAGVIPIIFASSVLMFPGTIAQFVQIPWVQKIAGYFAWGTPFQTTVYALLIIFFTYFYTAVTFKIPEMAENLKKFGGFIPGVRPGQPTEDYLDYLMTRVTMAGSIFLAFIAILPSFVSNLTSVEGVYFGGTALLIVVGVALDTMKQIEALVVMRHYQGFMK